MICPGFSEFTVEAGRPDSITREKLEVLRSATGLRRISINPQTMNQKTLDVIGRRHTVDMVKEKFALAREMGFDNINMDSDHRPAGRSGIDDVRATHWRRFAGHGAGQPHRPFSRPLKRAARLNLYREQYADYGHPVNTQEMVDLTARCAREMGLQPYYLYRQKNMAGNFENVGYAPAWERPASTTSSLWRKSRPSSACGAGTTTKVAFPAENQLERVENVKDVGQYIERIDEMIARKEKMLEKLP